MSTLLRTATAFVLAIGFAAPVVGQSPTLTVRGAGTGANQDAAVKDALADAVLQVVAVVLDGPTLTKHKATVTERVLPKAADFVKSQEVLKLEKDADGKVSVRVRATVDRAAVIAKLTDAGIPVAGAAAKTDGGSADLAEKVVKFCKENLGQTVGDGECGTLAAKALEAAGATPFHKFKETPGTGDFVWGELVFIVEIKDGKRKRDPPDGKAQAGDVVQYRDAMFRTGSGGIFLAPHHTAVVGEVKSNGDLIIYQQNVGKREVTKATLQPNSLAGGWIRVYRPTTK
jgi:hypothetical protein